MTKPDLLLRHKNVCLRAREKFASGHISLEEYNRWRAESVRTLGLTETLAKIVDFDLPPMPPAPLLKRKKKFVNLKTAVLVETNPDALDTYDERDDAFANGEIVDL